MFNSRFSLLLNKSRLSGLEVNHVGGEVCWSTFILCASYFVLLSYGVRNPIQKAFEKCIFRLDQYAISVNTNVQ